MKTYPNYVWILNETTKKQSQNTHVEVHIFARQTSKARSRVWIVQNNLHIAKTEPKELALNSTESFAAEMKLPTPLHASAWTISMNHPFLFHRKLSNQSVPQHIFSKKKPLSHTHTHTHTYTRLGFKCLIDSTLTINTCRWLSMVVACIARNRPAWKVL